MIVPDIFNVINKVRYSGINSDPKTVPTLFKQSAKVFANELNRRGKLGVRIAELHDLPAVAVSCILEEMSHHQSLSKTLHQELSDPILFMKVFIHHGADRSALENCLRKASLTGKPVLPEMAKNWCQMMTAANFASTLKRIKAALMLGTYLHEAGWSYQSTEVLDIAFQMIAQAQDCGCHSALKIKCMRKILRAKGSALLRVDADVTCSTLLEMTSDIKDGKVLLEVFLEVANHHFKAHRAVESHRWTVKALQLISESTKSEIIVEILQMEALYQFYSRRYDAGSMIIGQAIHRARSTFGEQHRRYADTLYTYGVCLLKANAISDAISILLKVLDIITKLYGKLTPHVAIIHSYLAYGFYRRSQITGRFDMAHDHIQKAIELAKQIMPERRQVIDHFGEIRDMIMQGPDQILVAVDESRVESSSNFRVYSISEIKQKCRELNDEQR